MPTETTWRPAPDGPPPDGRNHGHHDALFAWLRAHPGEWAVVERVTTGAITTFKKHGFTTTSRPGEPINGKPRFDVWIRLEEE